MSRSEVHEEAGLRHMYAANYRALDFLEKNSEAKFAIALSGDISTGDDGIAPTSKILYLTKNVDFSDIAEFRGMSRGRDFSLLECANFFNRYGIRCNKDDVATNSHFIETVGKIFEKLNLDLDKQIIIPTPSPSFYFQLFSLKNIGFKTLPTRAENNFLIDAEELEKMIVETGIKTLLLCYPNNPTGAIMTEKNARVIAEVVKRYDVFVISDEAFLRSSLSEKKHFSIAAVEGMIERSITVSDARPVASASIMSFCVGRKDIVNIFTCLGGHCVRDHKLLAAAIEDSAENAEYLEQCRAFYLRNIDLIGAKISELNKKFCDQFSEEKTFVKPFIARPDAANVYLLDFSGLRGKRCGDKILNSGLDVAQWLLEDAKVGTVPGECFLFEPETMLVRIALNHAPRELEVAFNSMIEATTKIESPAPPIPISGDRVIAVGTHVAK